MFHQNKNNPFRYYDPRSLGCYKNLSIPNGVIIPTTDDGAWEYFTKYNRVYSKIYIALSQKLNCGPMGLVPKEFPIFIKPIYNLHGAGIGSKILKSRRDYEKNKHLSGYFWVEYLRGEHLSHDLIIANGKIVYFVTFKGHSLGQGMFDYWEIIKEPKYFLKYISQWIRKNLNGFTGCVNIETIGDTIIECHLRMGDIDRLGRIDLMQNIVNLYAGKKWNFYEKIPKFYIFVLWGKWNTAYKINAGAAHGICKDLTCYQIDEPKLYFQNPNGGVRVAIVCSYDKPQCIKARYSLYKNFKPKPRKPKIVY